MVEVVVVVKELGDWKIGGRGGRKEVMMLWKVSDNVVHIPWYDHAME
jgi:hypothetical protein